MYRNSDANNNSMLKSSFASASATAKTVGVVCVFTIPAVAQLSSLSSREYTTQHN